MRTGGPPVLDGGGQDDIAVNFELSGCELEGPPVLGSGGQDDIAVNFELC